MATLLPHLRRNLAAYSVLLVGMALTAVSTAYVHRSAREQWESRFDDAVDDGTLGLHQRMDTYLAMLLGARGLFASSREVERSEFHAYVESLDLRRRYPGIQGIGFAPWVTPERYSMHVDWARANGLPDYQVWPPGERSAYAPIVYLEPLDPRNQRAFGFDMYSQPTRRAAMDRARDTGLPSATGRVHLVQELPDDHQAQPGVLLYVPIFDWHEPSPSASPRPLLGFVYAPFRMGDLFDGLRFTGFRTTIDMDVYDGVEVRPDSLLYRSHAADPGGDTGSHLKRTVRLSIGGMPWTLVFTSREVFYQGQRASQQNATLGGGLLVTLLLFLITRSQVGARDAAEAASAVQRQLATEAQDAVRVRDEFLGVAAHELRTPLTALKLQFQLLQRQLRQGPSDAARLERGLVACDQQASRLSQLVDRLLDLSRLASGRLELQLESLDLAELVRELTHRFEPQAEASGVRLTVEAPHPVPGQWDRLRVEQVLTNLLSNALKYGSDAPVDVRLVADETQAWLEVKDRGIGISPEDAPRIFGRFERAVSSRHYGGLGLGLFITRELVESLGGHISVASAPGQGSTFTVLLPRSGPRGDVPTRHEGSPPPAAPPLH